MNKNSSRQAGRVDKKGFTLVELMVTIAIFALITVVLVIQEVRYGGDIVLSNLAYDVALTVREAQVFGQSVREAVSGVGDFQSGYGVHFGANEKTSYIFFADRLDGVGDATKNNKEYDGDGTCTDPVTDECSQKLLITQGLLISRFCVRDFSNEYCSDGPGPVFDTLDIIYERPNPDATIRAYNSGTQFGGDFSEAEIHFSSPNGRTRSVIVTSTGQISIRRP